MRWFGRKSTRYNVWYVTETLRHPLRFRLRLKSAQEVATRVNQTLEIAKLFYPQGPREARAVILPVGRRP